MIYRTITKHSDVKLPSGQTWTVTKKVPLKKSEMRTLAKYFKAMRVVILHSDEP